MPDSQQEMSAKFHPLPCLFTIASLFCGFYSILAAVKGDFSVAATAILIAAVFDGLDGRVARMTGTTSTFGKELDSLCDQVSFGVAPAVLAYYWALQPYGRYGWLAGFLYVATTALRLARFNSQPPNAAKDFVGLPCPAAAAVIAAAVLFSHRLGLEGTIRHTSIVVLVYALSYLMVSSHRYLSFKQRQSVRGRTFPLIICTLLLFVLIAAEHEIMLFVLFMLYSASGPAMGLLKRTRKTAAEASSPIHRTLE
jgi:CDP-diacylglycerol--serine O-phosphatidyltransferase